MTRTSHAVESGNIGRNLDDIWRIRSDLIQTIGSHLPFCTDTHDELE